MDAVPVADQQILVGTEAVVAVIWKDQHGEPVAASGDVAVQIADANGSEVVASTAATADSDGDLGRYTYTLTAASNPRLAFLTATWTDTAGTIRTTRIEVVGGFWFTTADVVAAEPSLAGREMIHHVRREVEAEAERIIGWSFVPRYARATLDGTGDSELLVPDLYLRTVRSVRIVLDTGESYTFTDPELAELIFPQDAVIRRPIGKGFDQGHANVVLEYEHGWDRPTQDLQRAAIARLRYRLNAQQSGMYDRATSYNDANGQTIQIAPPSASSTGMPDVDAVYQGVAAMYDGGSGPASRPYDLDPSELSLYHGWRR